MDPIISQINLIHIVLFYSTKVQMNIIPPMTTSPN